MDYRYYVEEFSDPSDEGVIIQDLKGITFDAAVTEFRKFYDEHPNSFLSNKYRGDLFTIISPDGTYVGHIIRMMEDKKNG